MEELTVFGKRWQYRGEGNANIVIAFTDELRVLRLPKVVVGSNGGDWEEQRKRIQREVAFAYQVFIPLLGLDYVGNSKAVIISPQQIQLLNKYLLKERPEHRRHKELQIPFATIHRDFARIHSYPSRNRDYCVEIKPKQGWWPPHLKDTSQPHPNLCTFCLNQFLKLQLSKIHKRSDYCPLDLFSGCPQRMIKAIIALVANPQNNLRIFRDGVQVYGDNKCDSLGDILQEWFYCDSQPSSHKKEESTLKNLAFLLCTALLKPKANPHSFPSQSEKFDKLTLQLEDLLLNSSSPSEKKGGCHDIRAHKCLPQGSVLDRILKIQQMAEVSGGVERIYSLYTAICPVHKGQGKRVRDDEEVVQPGQRRIMKRKSEVKEMLETEQSLAQIEEGECPGAQCLSQEKWVDELTGEGLSEGAMGEVESYLIAATAKDSSIMITFSPFHNNNRSEEDLMYPPPPPSSSSSSSSLSFEEGVGDMVLVDLEGRMHWGRIGVADLTPKPLSCIVKHFLRDRDMLADYHTALTTHTS